MDNDLELKIYSDYRSRMSAGSSAPEKKRAERVIKKLAKQYGVDKTTLTEILQNRATQTSRKRRTFAYSVIIAGFTVAAGAWYLNPETPQLQAYAQRSFDWHEEIKQVATGHNFPGRLSLEDSLTLGVAHADPNDLDPTRVLATGEDEELFRSMLPVLDQIASQYKLVFIAEGIDTGSKILTKDQARAYHGLIPESLITSEFDWQFCGVDHRKSTFGRDYLTVLSETAKIWEKIDIILSVPVGQTFNPADEFKAPVNTALKAPLTDDDYARLFTFGKLLYQTETKYHESINAKIDTLISQGYFPIPIVGAYHAPCIKNSFVMVLGGKDSYQTTVEVKRNQFLGYMFTQKYPDYKPRSIPANFAPFQSHLSP
ncbi:MAG: hypothetical protein KJ601_02370 [Nanoarchaeota archaeon]|nr:hypothetical protein [Nanoarchaeota archaeon]MBU1704513.1 hypothetical protein [Nanoarchaeota archaeon]